jgi:hypothetical protein
MFERNKQQLPIDQNMKIKSILTAITPCAIAIGLTACNKSSTNNNPTGSLDSQSAATNAAVQVATNAVAQVATTATNKEAPTTGEMILKTDEQNQVAIDATNAMAAANNALGAATSQFDSVVATAKQAIADKNYQGALDALSKLSGLKLTDEQQKIVDDLKAQAQKMLAPGASGAADAAKNLLGK